MRIIFLSILFFYCSPVCAQYPSIVFENDEDSGQCIKVIYQNEHGDTDNPPASIARFLNCHSNIAQSGEMAVGLKRYIAFIDFPKLCLYDFKTQKLSVLLVLPKNSEGQAKIQWENNGDEDDTTELVLININRHEYKKGSKLFLLSICNGQLTKKFSQEINAKINCTGKKCTLAGYHFHDKSIEYKTADKDDLRRGIKIRRFRFPQKIHEKRVLEYAGSNNWWSIADYWFYEVLDKKRNRVPLPLEVEKTLRKGIAKISPDGNKMLFVDYPKIKLYDFETRKVKELVILSPDTEVVGELTWSPSNHFLAFVGKNEAEYTTGKKLFVFDISSFQVKKYIYDVQIDDDDLLNDFNFTGSNILHFRSTVLLSHHTCNCKETKMDYFDCFLKLN